LISNFRRVLYILYLFWEIPWRRGITQKKTYKNVECYRPS